MKVQQRWSLFLSDLERSISILKTTEDYKVLLNSFESIDEDYRDHNFNNSYQHMWKVALRSGNLVLANSYAKKFLQHLVDYKRIPQIAKFIKTVNQEGLLKNKTQKYLMIEEILLGKIKSIKKEELENLEYFIDHPEYWKNSKEFLKEYLLLDENWSIEQWTYCYEYVLVNQFDKDIFITLLSKTGELKNKKYEKMFIAFFASKNMKFTIGQTTTNEPQKPSTEHLNLDYDQVAMDLLSGIKKPNIEEQKRVINSLKFIPENELIIKGSEMIIAFELLGMEQVVLTLCEKMIALQIDAKQRASTYYVWAHALINNEEFYKSIDLIDNVLQAEPLIGEERLAFLYLKAESCLKLKKIKMAKELYLEIKKQNPNYRLVGERLKAIETT